jgi:hypothetical protein
VFTPEALIIIGIVGICSIVAYYVGVSVGHRESWNYYAEHFQAEKAALEKKHQEQLANLSFMRGRRANRYD